MSSAEVGGTFCTLRTAIVSASMTSTVLYAEAANFCTLLTARWVFAQSVFSTMSYAKAALFCSLLTARWVLAWSASFSTMPQAETTNARILLTAR